MNKCEGTMRLRSCGCVTCARKCSFPSLTGAHALQCLDLEEREVCLGVAPKAGLTSFGLEGDERKLALAKLKMKQDQILRLMSHSPKGLWKKPA